MKKKKARLKKRAKALKATINVLNAASLRQNVLVKKKTMIRKRKSIL